MTTAGYQYQQTYPQNQLTVATPARRHSVSLYQTSVSPSPSRSSSEYEYHEYYKTETAPSPAPAPPSSGPLVPMIPCHTCAVCGEPRSRKFHHHFPVIPGQPIIHGTCAKCDRKENNKRRVKTTRLRSIHRRSSDIRIRITSPDRGRARGRSSSSERITVRRVRSSSRDAPRARSHSRTRIMIRSSSQSPSPVREARTRIVYRSSSSSPPRQVVKTKTIRESVHRALDAFCKTPPSPGHRPQSVSPVRGYRTYVDYDLRADAERRIASHPMPYRHHRVLSEERVHVTRSPSPSPPPVLRRSRTRLRSILRSPNRTQDQKPLLRSQESTMVEVGGPRVQFAADLPRGRSVTETGVEFYRGRSRTREESPARKSYTYRSHHHTCLIQ
jgi:hypothetical protein